MKSFPRWGMMTATLSASEVYHTAMTDDQTQRLRHRLFGIAYVTLGTAALALVLLALSGIGYREGWWGLDTGFGLLRWGGYLGIAAALPAAAAAVMLLWFGPRYMALVASIAMLTGAIAAVIPYAWQQEARRVPPIHDITTDTDSPPAFVAIRPLRDDAPNPPEYAGGETARAQRQAYPDIRPIVLDMDPDRAFAAALNAAESLGWELVAVKPGEGRIEATDTTQWFGFKDDVVIRIRDQNDRARVDIRSKSRVGRSDVGTNARRIRDFREALSRHPATD